MLKLKALCLKKIKNKPKRLSINSKKAPKGAFLLQEKWRAYLRTPSTTKSNSTLADAGPKSILMP